MSIVAEWLFILALVLPPVAVVLAAIGVLMGSRFRRRPTVKTASKLPMA